MEACKVESNVPLNGVHVDDKSKGFQEDLCHKHAFITKYFVSLKEDIGSDKWLRTIFKKLLLEIESCLEVVKDVVVSLGTSSVDDHPFSWAPFLVVMKGFHAIAKLYDHLMKEFLLKLQVRHPTLNILIRQLRWHDDHLWLLDYEFLFDFQSKKRRVMTMLPEPQDDHDERKEVIIHTSQLLT
jgi:E3 ubiquitin-protein ligase NEDD4